MKDLIKRNYDAIVSRGLITGNTSSDEFYFKAKEELKEVGQAICLNDKENEIEEWGDLANVCFNRLLHLGVDPIEVLTKIAVKNENRVKK